MGVYRTVTDAMSARHNPAFFDTLQDCIATICKEGSLVRLNLSPESDPCDKHPNSPHERDFLLLRDGTPLVAVFMRYSFSGGPHNLPRGEDTQYINALMSTNAAPIADVQQGLADRLRAQVPKEEPKAPPKPSYTEGKWVLVFRIPGESAPEVFQGSPMDLDGVDGAFSRLVDIIVARIPKKA